MKDRKREGRRGGGKDREREEGRGKNEVRGRKEVEEERGGRRE